jgi:osmoprotectant transport system substrate-binding protein
MEEISVRNGNMRIRTVTTVLLLAALVALVAACGGGGSGSGSGGEDKSITVSSKKFTEQILLGEMYGQAFENAGYDVERRLNLGSEQIMDKSLRDGSIDVYPEYTGTALVAIVEDERGKRDTPEETYQVVKEFYANRDPKMAMLEPAPFDNNYGIVMLTEKAEELGIENMQDLADNSDQLVFSSYSEFQNRADGFPNMQENYNDGFNFKDIKIVNDLGIRYKALAEGEADVAIGYTTDGQLASDELRVIEDTEAIWPYYYPAPVLMQKFLDDNPDAEKILDSVSQSLDAEKMRALNGAVDLEQEDYEDVAEEHLKEAGVID